MAYCYNRYKTKKGDSFLDPLFGFGITLALPSVTGVSDFKIIGDPAALG
jgi:hypothetical protein